MGPDSKIVFNKYSRKIGALQDLFLVCVLIFFASCTSNPKIPLNVIIILTDDQGWGDVAFHKNDIVETPNLTKLSSESIEFTRFYVSPVCAPTRASIFTGKYHLSTGTSWVTHRKEVMRDNEYTLAELFKDNGYKTGLFGKWHNGKQFPNNPTGQGFDEFIGFTDGHLNNYFNSHILNKDEKITAEGYLPDYLTKEAINFMDNSEGPFFCMLTLNTPHSPFQVPDSYFDKYKEKGMSDKDACVYGMVENIDDNIGNIEAFLKKKKLDDNTILIFMTDNGPNGVRYNGGFKGVKGHVDEGGVRVPFLIKIPGHKPMVTDEAAAHIDLFPTLAKLTAIKIPDNLNLHGRNISDALTGKKLPDRMFFTHQVRRKLDTIPGALRTDKYLLTLLPSDTLLYNLLEDPFQKNPITQKVLQDSLVKAYQKWFIENTKTFDEYIPIQTGHTGIGKVELPATDIKETEGSHFYGGFGWANDWLVHNDSSNWTWGIKEVKGNRYELHLEYSLDSIGPEGVEVEYYIDEILKGKESLKIKVGKEKLESPDRVVRGEVYEYIWKSKKMGEIDIPKGEFNFKLEVRGKGYFELKALYLVKI